MKSKIRIALALSAVLGLCQIPHAQATTFSYTGNNFTSLIDVPQVPGSFNTTENVTGTFTTSSALSNNLIGVDIEGLVTSFSFSDVRTNLTNLNTTAHLFIVWTDASGHITQWIFDLANNNAEILARQTIANDGTQDDRGRVISGGFADQADVLVAGTLTPTPLPAALPLFASGLGVIGLLARRRKRQSADINRVLGWGDVS